MKEIGIILRKAREERGVSVEEVNGRTRIPVKYIVALEEGDRSSFPAEVYYTGSLRRYAQFLNLNDAALLEQYRNSMQQTVRSAEAEEKTKSKTSFAYPKIFIGAGICIVLGLIIAALSRVLVIPRSIPVSIPAIAISTAPAAATGTAGTIITSAPVAPSVSTTVATSSSAAGHDPVQDRLKLSIQSIKDTWMRVSADDTIVYDDILIAGDQREWAAKKRYHVIFGFLTGVKASLNGHPIDIKALADPNTCELWLTKESLAGVPRARQPAAPAVSTGTAGSSIPGQKQP